MPNSAAFEPGPVIGPTAGQECGPERGAQSGLGLAALESQLEPQGGTRFELKLGFVSGVNSERNWSLCRARFGNKKRRLRSKKKPRVFLKICLELDLKINPEVGQKKVWTYVFN